MNQAVPEDDPGVQLETVGTMCEVCVAGEPVSFEQEAESPGEKCESGC